ncbi:MAG: ribosome silencing factor [Actinobacteria bacterium]|nr:ribosome silencing factor [Actinomycetota bacterium]
MPATPEAIATAVSACRAADDKQAGDLVVLDVADLLTLVDVFVIATARTDRQLKAVAEGVEERLRGDHGVRPLRREGPVESGWVLLDFGDVVCHLFDQERREFYALERLWADVPHLDPFTGEPLMAGHLHAVRSSP